MLSTPKYGWSRITIGNWSDRCSYLDDVPILLLEGVLNLYKTNNPSAIKFDAEGYGYILIFDFYQVHIITDADDGYSLETVDILLENLTEELISDIHRDLNLWIEWLDGEYMTNEQKKERRQELFQLINAINEARMKNE